MCVSRSLSIRSDTDVVFPAQNVDDKMELVIGRQASFEVLTHLP